MNCVTVKHKGLDLVVRELTVGELEAVLADDEVTTFDRVFDGSMVTENMVRICTGLGASEVQQTHPSELRPVVEAIKEVNTDFLSGMASIMARRVK